MKYLLDTDTIIYWLNGNQDIEDRAISVGLENISCSIISKAELYYGAYNSEYVEQNLAGIRILSEKITTLSFDDKAAAFFGKTKAYLKRKGRLILDADVMISSIALANDLTLVTNNANHFERITNLRVENWKK